LGEEKADLGRPETFVFHVIKITHGAHGAAIKQQKTNLSRLA
jgi:hypothetical protein